MQLLNTHQSFQDSLEALEHLLVWKVQSGMCYIVSLKMQMSSYKKDADNIRKIYYLGKSYYMLHPFVVQTNFDRNFDINVLSQNFYAKLDYKIMVNVFDVL